MEFENAEFALPERYEKSINERILKVKVNIKNTGDKPLLLMEEDFSLYIKDEKMKLYDSNDEDLLNYEEIDKGRKVSGTLYFDVKEAPSYELEYKNIVWIQIKKN